jgi:SAM-dependent methyltransferase
MDLGCGTGSVSILLAQRGHPVLGIDVSPKMVERAADKTRIDGLDLEFMAGDVQTATVPATPYGAVVSRHLLWAVHDPEAIVARWSAPLTDNGLFVAIEGVWDRAGIAPAEVFSALQIHFQQVEYIDLTDETTHWGMEVTDHRYAVVGNRPRGSRARV